MTILEIGVSHTNSILQLLGVSILFVIILIITYYTTKFVGGVKLGQTQRGNFKVLETYKVTQNKYLQLVQIGTRYFVISIGKDDIQFITELQENEFMHKEQTVSQAGSFVDILTKLTNKSSNILNGNKINDYEKDHDNDNDHENDHE